MKTIHFSLVAVLLLLGSCSKEDMVSAFAPKEEDKGARAYIQQLQEKKFDNIEAQLDPEIKKPGTRAALEKMSAMLPAGPPKSIKNVGAQSWQNGGTKDVNLTYEFEYPSAWLLINVATRSKEGKTTIVGFNVLPEKQSIAETNKFSLVGKQAKHYLFLLLAVAAAVFTLFTLVACVRIQPIKRKWLWIVGILFGFGQFELNWATGEFAYNFFSAQLFSAGAYSAPFGPWILSTSIPVFAFVFWIRRNSLIRRAELLKLEQPLETVG